jgi:hypothetical protein
MNTALGTIGGVADPSWREVWIKTGDSVRPATVVDGLFTAGFATGHTTIGIADSDRPAQWTTLPLPTQPPITVVDARQGPAPDRSSGRGRILDDCVKAAGKTPGVIDPDSWEPGAMIQYDDATHILARNAYGYSSCSYSTSAPGYGTFGHVGGRGRYQAGRDASRGPAPKAFSAYSEAKTGQIILEGVVVAAECRRVQIIIAGTVTAEADVANSTFAALLPPGSVRGPSDPRLTYRLYDTTGNLTYEGP